MPSRSQHRPPALTGPCAISHILRIWLLKAFLPAIPSFAIRLGLVVTPSRTPRSYASLISSMLAVSMKNFTSGSCKKLVVLFLDPSLFEMHDVALLAAKIDDLTFNYTLYPFLFHEISTAFRIADEFGFGRCGRIIARTGRRKKLLPDFFYEKVGYPRQQGVDKKTSHFNFPLYEFTAGSQAQEFDTAFREQPARGLGCTRPYSILTAVFINHPCFHDPGGAGSVKR